MGLQGALKGVYKKGRYEKTDLVLEAPEIGPSSGPGPSVDPLGFRFREGPLEAPRRESAAPDSASKGPMAFGRPSPVFETAGATQLSNQRLVGFNHATWTLRDSNRRFPQRPDAASRSPCRLVWPASDRRGLSPALERGPRRDCFETLEFRLRTASGPSLESLGAASGPAWDLLSGAKKGRPEDGAKKGPSRSDVGPSRGHSGLGGPPRALSDCSNRTEPRWTRLDVASGAASELPSDSGGAHGRKGLSRTGRGTAEGLRTGSSWPLVRLPLEVLRPPSAGRPRGTVIDRLGSVSGLVRDHIGV
ncbi:hypothetical protein M885DRAFT_30782 [Pelagophyceae sp. CCMP2097]|nr:hypothetical protein M885DRAFT_30782 [Pelagophyceae sp. CCMP2097]|mmetsp:Transcript_14493/g.51559  ORF Transcript_14493/g.51559 Transcript_14493/m.51559 type:complete len:304 (-) Transcript_14493:609-1520(-)